MVELLMALVFLLLVAAAWLWRLLLAERRHVRRLQHHCDVLDGTLRVERVALGWEQQSRVELAAMVARLRTTTPQTPRGPEHRFAASDCAVLTHMLPDLPGLELRLKGYGNELWASRKVAGGTVSCRISLDPGVGEPALWLERLREAESRHEFLLQVARYLREQMRRWL